jgi:L-asparagine oxygenase
VLAVTAAVTGLALPAYDLSPAETASITDVLQGPAGDALVRGHPGPATRRLPERLLEYLYEFQLTEPAGGVVIRGFPVDSAGIGPTPGHWREAARRTSTIVHERYLLALASVLGETFAFRALQDGRMVQDLLPIAGHEEEKSGTSSRSVLDLHTEDAFHPHRCDYLGLLCLRNLDGTPTTYAELAPAGIPKDMLEILFQPRFTIEADSTHGQPDTSAPVALLWGARDRPYLRIDGGFTEPVPGDAAAEHALAALTDSLDRSQRAITLRPGEAVFIDNHLAAHGRPPFQARYDGTDRWMKRVSVTRNLRRSRELRAAPSSRILE